MVYTEQVICAAMDSFQPLASDFLCEDANIFALAPKRKGSKAEAGHACLRRRHR